MLCMKKILNFYFIFPRDLFKLYIFVLNQIFKDPYWNNAQTLSGYTVELFEYLLEDRWIILGISGFSKSPLSYLY